jgi:hypothetical protein
VVDDLPRSHPIRVLLDQRAVVVTKIATARRVVENAKAQQVRHETILKDLHKQLALIDEVVEGARGLE